MTTIEKIFNNLGLSPKTYLIYDQVVKNGPILASWLAKSINMPRATVYLYLEELLSLGLIATTGSYKKRKFIAEDPKRIIELVENKSNKFMELIPEAEKIAKEVTANLFMRKFAIPEVKYFIGREKARKVIEENLNAKSKEILGIMAIYDIYETLGEDFLKKYTEQRIKKGIKVKNVWPKGKIPALLSKHKEQLRDVRFSAEQENFTTSFLTYDDMVILITSKEEMLTIQIKSQSLAQAIRTLFKFLWEGASIEN